MQKFYSILLGSMILCLGCSQIIDENGIMDSSIEITGESVMKKFYTKNLSNAFSDFIKNPEENTCRTAVSSNTEDFFFENMWEDLNEEEKQLFLENVDNINVSKDSIISVKNDTSMGRAILNGDTSEIDSIAALYSYDEWLADIFGDEIINFSFKGIESSEIEEKVPVHLVINYLSKNEEWDEVEKELYKINSEFTVKDIKHKYIEMKDVINSMQTIKTANRASITIDYQDSPIREHVGETLADGTVILTCFKKKAFPIIGGDWAHAGLFSEEEYRRRGRNDSVHCVYTAQPDEYNDFPDYMKPDRENKCCLDTISMYSYQKKMATLLPKNYTSANAAKAVKYAKENFYDKDDAYNIPVNEFFYIGNTSHDLTSTNPYCSKVVYSAWENAGVDLDSNTSCGNIVSPDDLYGSAFDRYVSITVSILWWSKTWTYQTYSATSDIITTEYQK